MTEGEYRHIYRRTQLPYGQWTCADGREVLFNREYRAIWERHNGVVKRSNPNEWVESIVVEDHFYNDGDPYRHPRKLIDNLERTLRQFRIGHTVQEYNR